MRFSTTAAGKATALATSFAREPALRAMAFYNLGRVNEALGEFGAAQGSYAASLALRDNREVRVRLEHLAPALLASHRLTGPFVRPEDFCPAACEIERDPSSRWGGAAAIDAPFRALIDQQVRIQKAENRAAELGNAQLQTVVDCSKHHVTARLQSLSESVAPVNRLIAQVNVFAQLAGLGPLPDLSGLGSDAAVALQPLEDTVQAMHQVRAAIPV